MKLQHPIEIVTWETTEFLASYIRPGESVLEVGCGDGHVARALADRGVHVIAVDSDEGAVARAQSLGVQATRADWLEFECNAVEAVAFTRSLHHINPLGAAVRKTWELIRPGGMLLLEEFAFDAMDEDTIVWFTKLLNSPSIQPALRPGSDEFICELLGSTNPLEVWRHDHDHDLHTFESMRSAIAGSFEVESEQQVPYVYRYLASCLPQDQSGAQVLAEVLREETREGALGKILLIGRRIVARK